MQAKGVKHQIPCTFAGIDFGENCNGVFFKNRIQGFLHLFHQFGVDVIRHTMQRRCVFPAYVNTEFELRIGFELINIFANRPHNEVAGFIAFERGC